MRKQQTIVLLLALPLLVTACGRGDFGKGESDDDITVSTHNVSVIDIDAVNKDSGEPVVIEGLPAYGGVLIVD